LGITTARFGYLPSLRGRRRIDPRGGRFGSWPCENAFSHNQDQKLPTTSAIICLLPPGADMVPRQTASACLREVKRLLEAHRLDFCRRRRRTRYPRLDRGGYSGRTAPRRIVPPFAPEMPRLRSRDYRPDRGMIVHVDVDPRLTFFDCQTIVLLDQRVVRVKQGAPYDHPLDGRRA
jgi:hypothetical protein